MAAQSSLASTALEAVEVEDKNAPAVFPEKTRVRLYQPDHLQNLHTGVILRALPNPSMKAEHQWYDVRFDNGSLGRFLRHFLKPVNE